VAIIRTILLRHVGSHAGMSIMGLSTSETEKEGTAVVADIFATQRSDRAMEEVVARISIEPEVSAVQWERGQG
jgi:putative Mg2+ transporter-C (MgtC) family protein